MKPQASETSCLLEETSKAPKPKIYYTSPKKVMNKFFTFR